MKPMRLYRLTRNACLKDLFDGNTKIEGINNLDIEKITHLVYRGDSQEQFLWKKK